MTARLSTCAVCAGTIKLCEGTGWWHMTGTDHGHRATPDDGAVSGPDRCDECGAVEGDDCEDDCDCSTCEVERALDDDADAYADRA